MCVHTLTPRGNRERTESGIYFKIFEKNTLFNEHPVYQPYLYKWTCNVSEKPKCQCPPITYSFSEWSKTVYAHLAEKATEQLHILYRYLDRRQLLADKQTFWEYFLPEDCFRKVCTLHSWGCHARLVQWYRAFIEYCVLLEMVWFFSTLIVLCRCDRPAGRLAVLAWEARCTDAVQTLMEPEPRIYANIFKKHNF